MDTQERQELCRDLVDSTNKWKEWSNFFEQDMADCYDSGPASYLCDDIVEKLDELKKYIQTHNLIP